jgi:hypothetical protein
MCACPALRPRQNLHARPLRRLGLAFRFWNSVGFCVGSFVAQSHGLHTRCLRFAGQVTLPPRKTRFRLVATLGRTGLVTRWVPMRSFLGQYPTNSPSPRLCLAHSKLGFE